MNKLYCIKFMIIHDYIVSVFNTFSEDAFIKKMNDNKLWTYEVIEDNETHKIVIAR